MAGFRWGRGQVVAVVGGVLLAGAVAAGGIVSAQSPSPSASSGPGVPAQTSRGDFAARLAQALGIPQSTVEDALRQLVEERRGQIGGRVRADAGGRMGQLAAIAQALGVSEQELRDAIRAARQQIAGTRTPGQPGQGPRMSGRRPDQDAFFEAIAHQLGRGVTGQQVREAFQSVAGQDMGTRWAPGAGRGPGMTPGQDPRMGRPDRAEIEQRAEEFLQRFAALLGVSVDQLREALRQIGGLGMGRRGR